MTDGRSPSGGYNRVHKEITVERRQFLARSIAASALAIAREGATETGPENPRDYYQK
jgi:hypothetical protein